MISKFFRDDAWIEGSALAQLDLLSATPNTIGLAAMPDLHPGKYGPVGCGLLSTDIRPLVIGSDIGCGIALYRHSVKTRKLRLDKAAERLRILDQPISEETAAELVYDSYRGPSPFDTSLGSIGGGNHFFELQQVHEILDQDEANLAQIDPDFVYSMTHTGSRGLGYSVLLDLIEKGTTTLDGSSEAGHTYMERHDHALGWARLNRAVIADRAGEAIRGEGDLICDLSHNFIEKTERGFLHRKGVAPSDRGLVPIPGSRETLSYLVKPLEGAPPEALACLAHGAGRKYDRASMHGRIEKAKSVREKMSRNPWGGTIVCEDRNLMLEEAGDAYKNIDRVIDDLVHFGLVKVVATFHPLVTFKTGQANIGRDRGDRR